MRAKNFVFGAFVAAVVARAAPQRGIIPVFPTQNATKTPTPTDASCVAECSVRYPELFAMSWVPEYQIVYTTEITVGTVSTITTVSGSKILSTRVHTVWGFVPPEYDLYRQMTDDAGTAIIDVGLTLSDGYTFSRFTYPTPWVDYPDAYHWQGVLPTQGKDSSTVCATATELDTGILAQHPQYPQPKELSPGRDDPSGTAHKPLWVPIKDEPDKAWFDTAFPSESAFHYCESVQGKPAPTQFEAAKFVFDTTTVTTTPTSAGVIVIQPTATGWEVTTSSRSFRTPNHMESTVRGFESTGGSPQKPKTTQANPHVLSTASGFDQPPDTQQTAAPPVNNPVPSKPGGVKSLANNNQPPANNPNNRPAQPAISPPPVPARPTPILTFVPTTINGKPTKVPAFVLPGSSETATFGQRVTIDGQPTVLTAPPATFALVPTTINGVETSVPAFLISGTSTASIGATVTLDGQPTVLSPPPALFTMLPTTINGVATSVPAYIISGSITATIGQTVTLDGQATVLAAPPPYLTMIATTINGVATTVPAYIISGTITAFPGQTVTIDGQTTVLSSPDLVLTSITTTINGVETVIPAYIISGSITATIGQTVTIDGQTTVLSTPTGTEAVDSLFGGPASTSFGGQAQETASKPGAAGLSVSVSWSSLMIAWALLVIIWS